MLLDELVSKIGSERAATSSASSRHFSWVYQSGQHVPADADRLLANALHSKEIDVSDAVVEAICQNSLCTSAEYVIKSHQLCTASAFKLLKQFSNLLNLYITCGNYGEVDMKTTLRENVIKEDQVVAVIDACISHLDAMLDTPTFACEVDTEELQKYVRFLSLMLDGKFQRWFLNSTALPEIGARVGKLASIFGRMRRSLVDEQTTRIRTSNNVEIYGLLQKSFAIPKYDGKPFTYHLSI